MATFQVNDSFYLTGRGLVATGRILTGTIKAGDAIDIQISGSQYSMQITSVEIGDNISVDEHFIGLILKSDSGLDVTSIKLQPQIVEVSANDRC